MVEIIQQEIIRKSAEKYEVNLTKQHSLLEWLVHRKVYQLVFEISYMIIR